jgi:hypothetical protein
VFGNISLSLVIVVFSDVPFHFSLGLAFGVWMLLKEETGLH